MSELNKIFLPAEEAVYKKICNQFKNLSEDVLYALFESIVGEMNRRKTEEMKKLGGENA